MDKLGKGLYKTFLGVFILFPLFYALLAGSKVYFEMSYKRFTLIIFLTVFTILFCFYLFLKVSIINCPRKYRKLLLAVILFFISMGIKYFLIIVMGENIYQNSEYGCVWRISSGLENQEDLRHVSVFPHWSLVGFINKGLMQLFNKDSVAFCQMVNAVILSIVVILLFYISYEITKSYTSAFLGGLVFSIAPTENIYFLMLSNEFLAIMAFYTITFILLKYKFFIDSRCNWKKSILVIGILGLNFWLLKYTKPVDKVFIVAILIIITIKFFIYGKYSIKQILSMLFLSIILSSFMSSVYIERLSNYTGYPINTNQSAHFLFIGLNSKYESVGNIYEQRMIEEKFDYDKVNKEYMDIIEEDVKINIKKLPTKLKDNFIMQWKDYNNGLRMGLYNYGQILDYQVPYLFTIEGLGLWGTVITQFFYLCVLCFSLFSVCRFLIFKKEYDSKYFFILLLCFGVTLGLIFGESQERYKCIIIPILYLLAGDGINIILKWLEKTIYQIRKGCIYKVKKFINEERKSM